MKEPQTNADGPSRDLLRPCFARLLALLVGQPDAFGTGASPLGQDKTAQRRCTRREAVGLGEGEARTAKQPQGPARSAVCGSLWLKMQRGFNRIKKGAEA